MRRLINPSKEAILATIPPPSTKTYKTISHGQIIDTLTECLDKEGFRIKEEKYSGGINNQIVVGHLILDLELDNELKFEIGFMNSYNKMKRAVVAGGSQVRVCENGHILGDISYGAFKRKHAGTASEDIKLFIPEMVKRASEAFTYLIRQKDRMKEIEVDKAIRNELIGQLYLDDNIITDTQMSIIKKEIDNPSFNYGTGENSLWHMYNNVTLALKTSHPAKWINNHQKLNKLVTERFELV